MLMHEECLEGNFVSIQKLREANPPRGITANAGMVMLLANIYSLTAFISEFSSCIMDLHYN